jgi:hypothetical protein
MQTRSRINGPPTEATIDVGGFVDSAKLLRRLHRKQRHDYSAWSDRMYLQKFIAQLQQAKALLPGFEAHAKAGMTHPEIERITRRHIEAEIAKLQISLERFVAKLSESADPTVNPIGVQRK